GEGGIEERYIRLDTQTRKVGRNQVAAHVSRTSAGGRVEGDHFLTAPCGQQTLLGYRLRKVSHDGVIDHSTRHAHYEQRNVVGHAKVAEYAGTRDATDACQLHVKHINRTIAERADEVADFDDAFIEPHSLANFAADREALLIVHARL